MVRSARRGVQYTWSMRSPLPRSKPRAPIVPPGKDAALRMERTHHVLEARTTRPLRATSRTSSHAKHRRTPLLGVSDVVVPRCDVEVAAERDLIGVLASKCASSLLAKTLHPAKLVGVFVGSDLAAVWEVGAQDACSLDASADQTGLRVVLTVLPAAPHVLDGQCGSGWRRRCRSSGRRPPPRSRSRGASSKGNSDSVILSS